MLRRVGSSPSTRTLSGIRKATRISVMNIAQTALDDLRIELAVTLNPDDYNPRVDRALKRHQQQAEMPGFRKGKVPLQLIRRQYGQSVLAEELNQMLGEQLQNHIQ